MLFVLLVYLTGSDSRGLFSVAGPGVLCHVQVLASVASLGAAYRIQFYGKKFLFLQSAFDP
jgi:hypothetical protein